MSRRDPHDTSRSVRTSACGDRSGKGSADQPGVSVPSLAACGGSGSGVGHDVWVETVLHDEAVVKLLGATDAVAWMGEAVDAH